MTGTEGISEIERLLLMAAAVHGLGPGTDLSRANTAKVVDQVLKWTGVNDGEVREAWSSIESHPAMDRVYTVLISMVQSDSGKLPERPGDPLFKGGGNWGGPEESPCNLHFNSCRLTELGERIAFQLLQENSHHRKDEIM